MARNGRGGGGGGLEEGQQSRVDNLPSSLRATSRSLVFLDGAEQKLPGLIYVRS